MTTKRLLTLALAITACGAIACGGSTATTDAGTAAGADAATAAGADAATATTLYERLGKNAGITTVITDFVTRVLKDPKINGYFLNTSVDGGKLISCLVNQVAEAAGGPEKYTCRTMKATHAGMKVSKADFDDLIGHLVAALTAANVSAADIGTLAGVVSPMSSDIVEDATSKGTVYQRVGRKPNIVALIGAFVGKVGADTRINGFFGAPVKLDRVATCLVRQVCSIDGPCKYGFEVDGATGEPGVTKATPCRGMLATHAGTTNPPGGAGAAITKADFDALVEDLVKTLDEEPYKTAVNTADRAALLGVLGGMCRDIVKNGTGCP